MLREMERPEGATVMMKVGLLAPVFFQTEASCKFLKQPEGKASSVNTFSRWC